MSNRIAAAAFAALIALAGLAGHLLGRVSA